MSVACVASLISAIFNCPGSEPRSRSKIELAENVGHVSFSRAQGDDQLVRDLPIGHAARYQTRHVQLAECERQADDAQLGPGHAHGRRAVRRTVVVAIRYLIRDAESLCEYKGYTSKRQ
jgi:hypothetical protein